MGLAAGKTFGRSRPGQFVMVRIVDSGPALLRRPFSIHRLLREKRRFAGVEILYRVVGSVTRRLCACSPGEKVDLLGPLGRGFAPPPSARTHDMVAGGIGVAPILFLAEYLLEKGCDASACRVFIGGRSRNDILCMEDFESMGYRVYITTDDGTCGEQCLVTEPLRGALAETPPDILYACGPEPMLQCTADMAAAHSVACQVSIETMMACGMGACLGCAVKGRRFPDKYLHACRDGPVFDASELVW